MPSFLSIILSLSLSFHSAHATQSPSRPLFNKKENLTLVQKFSKFSITKTELLSILEKRYGHAIENKEILQQLRAQNFSHLSWTMSYENNQITINVTQPEKTQLTIAGLDRLFSGAIVNGTYINFNAGLGEIAQLIKSDTNSASLFHLLFFERADAFIWLAVGFVAAIGFLAIGALAAGGDDERIQTAFNKISASCKADAAAKKTGPSEETKKNIEALKEFGFDLANPPWHATKEECVTRYSQRSSQSCRSSTEIHSCLAQLKHATGAILPAPGSATTN